MNDQVSSRSLLVLLPQTAWHCRHGNHCWFSGSLIRLYGGHVRNFLSTQRSSVLWILSAVCISKVSWHHFSSFLRCPFPASCERGSRWSLSPRTGPSSVELFRQRRRPRSSSPGGVASLFPLSPVYPAPFGVRRSGGWASKGRARHPPLPRPRHQDRTLTKAGFLNGPTTWKATSGGGLSSAMVCFHITGKFFRHRVQYFSK